MGPVFDKKEVKWRFLEHQAAKILSVHKCDWSDCKEKTNNYLTPIWVDTQHVLLKMHKLIGFPLFSIQVGGFL